jgi:beta-lactam-binding protein with PASTA domain
VEPRDARARSLTDVPDLVGMVVREARSVGHRAGLVVTSADLDGPPLGALTWPGTWVVTAQRPAAGTRLARWDVVVIEFEEMPDAEVPDGEDADS